MKILIKLINIENGPIQFLNLVNKTQRNYLLSFYIFIFKKKKKGGIYTRDAQIFRGSEERGYFFLPNVEEFSFISCSAYSNPPREENGMLGKKIAQLTKKKIESIFNIAVDNGHDSLILSAFGCGVYGIIFLFFYSFIFFLFFYFILFYFCFIFFKKRKSSRTHCHVI